VVHTVDPQYPSLTFSGNLPRLVVHVNESKILALQAMYNNVMGPSLSVSSPQSDAPLEEISSDMKTDYLKLEASRLIMMQFTVHQLALEVGYDIII